MKSPIVMLLIHFFFVSATYGQEPKHPTEEKEENQYIIIDGKEATAKELEALPSEAIGKIQILSSRDAMNRYGIQGAHGALVVHTVKAGNEAPLTIIDGKITMKDSSQLHSFQKIKVLNPRDAMELYGPLGKDGAYIVSTEEDSAPLFIKVLNSRSKPVKDVSIVNEKGEQMGTTDRCGNSYLERVNVGEELVLKKKGYETQSTHANTNAIEIILTKE